MDPSESTARIEFTLPPAIVDGWNESINRGMEFLDNYLGSPDWVNRLNLEELDLNDGYACVCGQLFEEDAAKFTEEKNLDYNMNGYEYALRVVMEHGVETASEDDKTTYYGFYLPELDYTDLGLDEETDAEDAADQAILIHNGFDPEETTLWKLGRTNSWELFTKMWKDNVEKRRAELGTI